MARRSRRKQRTANAIGQLEWRDVVNRFGPIELSDDEYEQPPLDAAIDEALVDYVERRKQESR